MKHNHSIGCVLFLSTGIWLGTMTSEATSAHRMPESFPPVLGCWFWQTEEFEPDGYREPIDLFSEHSPYDLLTTSIRAPEVEVTDKQVHDQIQQAAAYAQSKGLGIVMDLDVRLARRAFQEAYPDELQEMLRLREIDLSGTENVEIAIRSADLSDHYTFGTTPYIPLAGRLVRVYSYIRAEGEIEPGTVQELGSEDYEVIHSTTEEVRVSIKCDSETKNRKVCVAVAFTHLTPDVFAPHLIEFQHEMIRSYADTEIVGVCKDEWGFPPDFQGCKEKNDFWYSGNREAEYRRISGNRGLVRDCLLMTYGEKGRERERQAAINRFLWMSYLRNGEIEDGFYRSTKEVFGPDAVVATHPTWYPFPGVQEFKKNGLDWWIATRDWAQTDEVTPYCARTSLSKKWNSPVWYNMYYAKTVEEYERSLWQHAMAGGRINYHPLYPVEKPASLLGRQEMLLAPDLVRGECRIRLLNFITKNPLDCPVAVVFGHACAMNWAGPAYADVGMQLADSLWAAGYPADLIPSSEIGNGSLQVGEDGTVHYGPQSYAGVVLYHLEFEKPETAVFFQKAAKGKTSLYRVGDWTADFEAAPYDGAGGLPEGVQCFDDAEICGKTVIQELEDRNVEPQTGATERLVGFGYESCAPQRKGICRLLDGTVILLAGEKDVSGDPIRETFEVHGTVVKVDALGVVGVRLAADGSLEALAAGGLKTFEMDSWTLQLDQEVDLALWKNAAGEFEGVVQDWEGPLPAELLKITPRWAHLGIPSPPGTVSGP